MPALRNKHQKTLEDQFLEFLKQKEEDYKK